MTYSTRFLALLSLATAAAAGSPALAQDPSSTVADDADAIVVTGTRLSGRTVTTSPVPIDVLTTEELQANGYSGTAKALQSLVPSINYPHPTTPDGNTHIRSLTLRGLSPDQTLVLVNGQRRHTNAWVNVGGTIGKGSVPTDLNAIPLAAIGRVEVLRDGASALYGSDAIAGVVNFILRTDEGFRGSASYGATQDGGGDTYELSGNWGFPVGEDGSLNLTYAFRDVTAADRAEPDTRQFYFGRSTTGAAVALSPNFGSGTGLNPPGGPAGTTLDPREASANRDIWRFADSADITQHTGFLNFRYNLANGVELYAFGGLDHSDGVSNASLRRPGQPENVRAIYPDGFLPFINTLSTNGSLALGAKGDLAGWAWDLTTSYGENRIEYRSFNTLNATLGAASPTRFYNGALEAGQWTTSLDFTRDFDAGLSTPVSVAFGIETRTDRYGISAGQLESYQFGPVRVLDGPAAGTVPTIGAQGFAGIQPGDAIDTDRTSWSVYSEATVTPVDNLLLTGAVRYENFSDFGETTNGQAAARWEIIDGVALRASVGSGFHAPALQQQYFSSTSSRTLANPLTGVPEFVLVRTAPVTAREARLLGARDLQPETAVNASAGVTAQRGGFSASIDAYQIDIDNRIGLSSNFVDAAGSSAIRNFLASQGLPGVTSVRYFTNVGDTRTTGVDINARWRVPTEALGDFTFTLGYNHNETELTRVATTPQELLALGVRTPLFDIAERIRTEFGQPEDNIQLGAVWENGPWTIGLRGVRYGEHRALALTNQTAAAVAVFRNGATGFYTLPTEAGVAGNFDVVQILEATWLTDLNVNYQINERVAVEAGANNLFNVYPTENIRSTRQFLGADTFGAFPYNEFSPFGWSGAFFYGRLRFEF
jgi:iron complex outermembrane receptor protein